MDNSIYFDGRHYEALWPGLQRQSELEFYLRRIHEFGEPVLELGCGTGQLTIALAQAGVTVNGLDLSEPMLTCAREKAVQQNVEVKCVNADCRDFTLDHQFGLIFFPANALLHVLTWQDLQACLHQVKQHLTPKGAFAFEIFNPSLQMLIRDPNHRYPVGEYTDPDGRGTVFVTENNVYDTDTQVNHIRWYYRIEGQPEETTATLNLRMYYPQEIEALLRYNGFDLYARYGDYDETPFTGQSSRQLIVCASTTT
jgi:SAM-dependent methyltransferase